MVKVYHKLWCSEVEKYSQNLCGLVPNINSIIDVAMKETKQTMLYNYDRAHLSLCTENHQWLYTYL